LDSKQRPLSTFVPKAESQEPKADLHGVLVIDKPAGPTSHDVVAVARRALRQKRIGHTGTLDPMATGVLPLVIGKATRLSALLSSDDKEYEADVRLGAATATYDAAERVQTGAPAPPAPDVPIDRIEALLPDFRGSFDQVPPPYSAKKLAGTPAYKLARNEQPLELAAVRVTVHELDVLGYESGRLRLRVRATSGFYVRSLAHDIGVRLGCGAHLEALRRTRAGDFTLGEAMPLAELLERPDSAVRRMVPLERLLPHVPAARLTPAGARKAIHGNFLSPSDLADRAPDPVLAAEAPEGGRAPVMVRLFDPEATLIGIARLGADGALRPCIVLV
jgi:tRNA pseudouridine55 synthase